MLTKYLYMNRILLLLITLFIISCNETPNKETNEETTTTKEAEKSPMERVKEQFAYEYPSATNVEWEEDKGLYEVSYLKNGKEFTVIYDEKADVVQKEEMIPVDELPSDAKSFLADKGEVTAACRIMKADGTVIYEAEVGGEDHRFDVTGNHMSKEADDGGEDDDTP